MKRVAIVGASGSIGRQTLEIARAWPDRVQVVALAAETSDAFLVEAAREFGATLLALRDDEAAARARRALGRGDPAGITVLAGDDGIRRVAAAPSADLVVSAAWGAAGLDATLAALEAGHDVALANKESLVAGGELVMSAARRTGARILPVDSEHSAAFQLLAAGGGNLRRLWITASGGPFRGRPPADLQGVTASEALRHPTWRMGERITIDSATLFNKGMEVIEAHWLFGLPYERIDVVVHPQSRVHAIAEWADGSFLAHAGPADMRLPIQYALSYPERWAPPLPPVPPSEWGTLAFEPVDREAFPALDLCYRAGIAGGTAPAVLNAAKEEAVLAFLSGRIPFTEIAETARIALGAHEPAPATSRAAVSRADAWARDLARRRIAELAGYAGSGTHTDR